MSPSQSISVPFRHIARFQEPSIPDVIKSVVVRTFLHHLKQIDFNNIDPKDNYIPPLIEHWTAVCTILFIDRGTETFSSRNFSVVIEALLQDF